MRTRKGVWMGVVGAILAGALARGADVPAELEARRQALLRQYEAQWGEDQARGLREIELILLGALSPERGVAQNLLLALRVVEGQVEVRRAWAPRFNRAEYTVERVALTFTDRQLRGRLTVTLRSDGFYPANDESLRLELDLTVPLDDAPGMALYDLQMPDGPGETGLQEGAGRVEVVVRQSAPARLPALPAEPAAATLEAYRQCRALALATAHRQAFDETLALTTVACDPADSDLPARLTRAALGEVRPVVAGPRAPDDSAFGPWTGARALDGDAVLRGADWRHPADWRQMADIPAPLSASAEVRHQIALFPGASDTLTIAGQRRAWRAVAADADGLVSAPKGMHSHLACATVRLAQAGRVWVALTPWLHELGRDTYTGRARLWLDDELVWSCDDADRQQREALAILPFDLPAGAHRLTVQAWRRNGTPAPFRLALRLGGEPLAGAALAAREAAIAAGIAREQARLAAQARGERINWRGQAPDARPPLAWDEVRGLNIAWRTPLPDWTIATPVVHHGRVFTLGNHHQLHCLDADTGARLWTGAFDPRELLDESPRAQLAEAWTAASNAWDIIQRGAAGTNLNALQRAVTAYHDLANRLGIEAFEFYTDDIFSFRRGHYMRYGGASSAPVTDGTHVWVRGIEGAVACFDREGRRRWMVRQPVFDIGGIPSLLLIDGVLVVEGSHEQLDDRSRASQERWVVGLDAATGARRWRTRVAKPRAMQGVGCTDLGSPIPVALSDGTRDRTVVVTVAGSVLDPRDGRLLADLNLGTGGTRQNQGYPVVEGRRVVFPGQAHHSAMVELHLLGDDVGVRRLWHAVCRHNNYGALIHDDRVWQHAWWFGKRLWKGHVSFMELLSLDAANGRMLTLQDQVNREIAETTTFPQLLLTHGDVLWAGSTEVDPENPLRGVKGTLTAVRIGPNPYVLARNHVERYVASPVAEDERLYIRTLSGLLCIGYTGDAGRAYEQATVAQTVFEELPARPVRTQPVGVAAHAFAAFPAAADWPPLSAPEAWHFRLLEGDAAATLPGLGGDPAAVRACDGSPDWRRPPDTAWVEREDSRLLDLLRIPALKQRHGLFLSVGRLDRRGVFELDLKGGTFFRAWMNGVPVKAGAPLRLEPGVYAVAVEVALPPAALPFGNLFLAPRLKPATDPERAAQRWHQAIRNRAAALRAVVANSTPDSPHGRTARELLKIAEGKDTVP